MKPDKLKFRLSSSSFDQASVLKIPTPVRTKRSVHILRGSPAYNRCRNWMKFGIFGARAACPYHGVVLKMLYCN